MTPTLRPFEIPSVIFFDEGQGGLPRARITSEHAQAEVYLHGAQVTAFQKRGEPPLLFLSRASRFAVGKAIRGGIPICYPWFGQRPGEAAHGFARLTDWELVETSTTGAGGAAMKLRLPQALAPVAWRHLQAELIVIVEEHLALELTITNQSESSPVEVENCFHTYFAVGDVREVEITGLESCRYLDQLDPKQVRTESAKPLRISAQTDRTYLDALGLIEIRDPVWRRAIRIEKTGSASTVVWNPWSTQPLADLASGEHLHMVCVESGNVGRNRLVLEPQEDATLHVEFRSIPLSHRGQGR